MSSESEISESILIKEGGGKSRRKIFRGVILLILVLVLVKGGFFLVYSLKQPPENFPSEEVIEIKTGSTLRDVAKIAKEKKLVKSELFFYAYFITFGNPSDIKASNYVFKNPTTVSELVEAFSKGSYAEGLIKLTLIEGSSVKGFSEQIKAVLPNFDTERFIELAKPFEGYLFPETYLVPDDFSPEELVDLLKTTFLEEISKHQGLVERSKLTLNEIVILASIVEREANSTESQKMVAGILQNRLTLGMPLQADASVEYILEKPLSELTPEDLKINSPYNTYLNDGLPPTPIGNPGINAILAVLSPTESDYLFYITGDDGKFYYAKTFDEHRVNIAKYLR